MTDYRFETACGPLDVAVSVPGSKSITNRALILAALADGVSVLRSILLADDTWLMIEALRTLGIAITVDEAGPAAEVTGRRGHIPSEEGDLFCGNSGTTIRFCTALAALSRGGTYRLDGIARMRRRPIGALTDALQTLGAGVEFHDETGFPPLSIHARGLRGGHVGFDTPASSQYISALLLVAPYAGGDVLIETGSEVPSVPYIALTVRMMEEFGVPVLAEGLEDGAKRPVRIAVETPQRYSATAYTVEPDATNAMYFLAAAAVAGGRVTVPDLGTGSMQGDLRFLDVLRSMGCAVSIAQNCVTVEHAAGEKLQPIDADMNAMPDLALTLAVLALFAAGTTTIRNVANLRLKETDRLAALARELSKLGASVDTWPDGLRITPPAQVTPAAIDTYQDHRMAMSFALAGLRVPGLTIRDPQCTSKTDPEFFARLGRMIRPG